MNPADAPIETQTSDWKQHLIKQYNDEQARQQAGWLAEAGPQLAARLEGLGVTNCGVNIEPYLTKEGYVWAKVDGLDFRMDRYRGVQLVKRCPDCDAILENHCTIETLSDLGRALAGEYWQSYHYCAGHPKSTTEQLAEALTAFINERIPTSLEA